MTSITTVAPQVGSPMTTRRAIACYLMEAKYSFIRALRNPAFGIPLIVFPVLFYLLIGYIFGAFQSKDPNVPYFLYCGFTTMAVIGPGMFGFGIGFAIEREHGLFNFKRALPMPPMASLSASVAMSMATATLATLLITVAALTLGKVSVSAFDVLGVVVMSALGAIPFCAIGLLIGSLTSGRAAPAIANIFYMVMIYFSGLFIPLPEGISSVVLGSPAFYFDQLLLASIGAKNFLVGSALNHIVVLLGVTVLCLGLAERRLAKYG